MQRQHVGDDRTNAWRVDRNTLPRQQIRTPSESLDLSRHLVEVDDLPDDVSSATLFGSDRPLEIEVGSGKGLFLLNASEQRPDHNFLGIEIARKYASHAAANLLRAGRTNAMFASGDALPVFEKQIATESIAAVHVYFPDPWWKKKHKKRRVLNEPFLRNVSRVLVRGGRFHFWTDVLEYFESAIELTAVVAPELGPPIPEVAAPATHDLDYRTHFERRSRRHEIPVYRVRFQKPS